MLGSEFIEALHHGVLYPRWLANMYGGYGYPNFVYYQPAFFYIMAFFSLFAPTMLTTLYASIIFFHFAGGLGTYLLISQLTAKRFALIFAMIFLCTPYIYVNLFVRGALTEYAALLLTPWPLYFLLRLKDNISAQKIKSALGSLTALSLSLAAIIFSHPATCLFYIPIFLCICFILSYSQNKIHLSFFHFALTAMALALILSAPYWLTVFQMKKHVQFEALTNMKHFFAWDNVVYFKQLFSNMWGFGHTFKGSEDTMSFQLGLPHFLLACLGTWAGRRNKFILTSFAVYLFLIAMMLPGSAQIWRNIGLLKLMQFPWRLLSVIAVFQIICISGLGSLLEKWSKPKRWTFVALIFVLLFSVHHKQFVPQGFYDQEKTLVDNYLKLRKHRFAHLNVGNEFLPVTIDKNAIRSSRGESEMIIGPPAVKLEALKDNSPYHIRYQFDADTASPVIINQFYFPGFAVRLNGKLISDEKLKNRCLPDGRMVIVVPSGKDQTLEAHYAGPPGYRIRNLLLGIGALLIFSSLAFNPLLRK